MDKKALLYLDDAKVISDILKEQKERSNSKVLIELLMVVKANGLTMKGFM